MEEGHLVVRRALAAEFPVVHSLVQTVVEETYGHLWTASPLPPHQDWSRSWIAIAGQNIVGQNIAGMMLTHNAWINDLWVLRAARDKGVGSRLLAQAEAEIAGRGYDWASLRVVQSNARALGFYSRHGWQAVRTFPHETLTAVVVEMAKPVASTRHQHW